jgi:hypothetical protein
MFYRQSAQFSITSHTLLQGGRVPAKVPNMATSLPKPRVGRPRKFSGKSLPVQLRIPEDLQRAAQRVQQDRKIEFPDAIRELLREAAEARGLVDRRK